MYDGIETCFFDHMPEDAVRRWTAAYIAHAKEKHAQGWLRCSGCLSLREGVVHSIFIVMLPYRGASVLVPILHLALAVKYLRRDQNERLLLAFLLNSHLKNWLRARSLTRGDNFV